MRKFLIVLLCGVLFFSSNLIFAQQNQQGVHEAGTGIVDPELMQVNQVTGQGLQGQEDTNQNPEYQTLDQGSGQNNIDQGAGVQTSNNGAESRRSRTSDARQFMLEVAQRNQGISQQIQNITQNQAQAQEGAENALGVAQKRSGFVKFFVGPDYGQLKEVENRLEEHDQNLEELKELRVGMDENDTSLFDTQIKIMEEVKMEMESELKATGSGFSLFGWMNKLFNY